MTDGSNNDDGHAYGNPAAAALALLLSNSRKMEEAGELSLKLKPSNNWGVFYSYVDDSN